MEKLKTLTIRQIHDWRPSNSGPDESFGRKALEKLFGGDSIPVLQFVDLDIPSGARLFVVLRPEVLGDAFAPCLADIAEHVLPIFQQKLPDDERPARAIAAIRGFARGEVGKGDLLKASRATENAGYDDNAPTHGYPPVRIEVTYVPSVGMAAHFAGRAAADAPNPGRVNRAAKYARLASNYASDAAGHPAMDDPVDPDYFAVQAASDAEDDWQIQCVRGYLSGERGE